MSEMLERVRGKDAKTKSEQDDDGKRSNKAYCEEEGGWKLGDKQLKANWECYPLLATETENGKPGKPGANGKTS